MIANVRCMKCLEEGKFDVGDVADIDAAKAAVAASTMSHCPFGRHMEMSPIKFEVLSVEDGAAPTLEEWLAEKSEKYDLWTTRELGDTEIEITSFAMGMPMAKVRGENFWLNFQTAPTGDRYYYAPKGKLAEVTA